MLDPFAGSFTTGVACIYEGRDFIGIEQDAEYVRIGQARIDWALAEHDNESKGKLDCQGRLPLPQPIEIPGTGNDAQG